MATIKSIEEKAKAYDKAIGELRGLLEGIHEEKCDIMEEDIIKIFPELKESEESEDEKIRKDIVTYLQQSANSATLKVNAQKFNKWIVWLEKQGEQKSIWHNEDEEPKRGSLILLIMQSGTPIVAQIIEPNHTFNHGERWAYIDDLLEKRGEQKLGTDFSDLRTWKYIVDAVWTEKEGIGQHLDSPFTEEVAKKLQKRFGNIEQILANSAKTCKDEQKTAEKYNITGIGSKNAQGDG